MGFRIFLKGKSPVVVDTIEKARGLVKSQTLGTLDQELAKYSDYPDSDPVFGNRTDTAKSVLSAPSSDPIEITLTEEDFVRTMPSSNIVRGGLGTENYEPKNNNGVPPVDSRAVTAPWDEQFVAYLDAWQASENNHPYTCPNLRNAPPHSVEDVMVAHELGFFCMKCGYHQGWALDLRGAAS